MQAGAQAGAVPGAGGLNLDVLEPVCVLQAKVTQKPQNPLAESLGRWRRGGVRIARHMSLEAWSKKPTG